VDCRSRAIQTCCHLTRATTIKGGSAITFALSGASTGTLAEHLPELRRVLYSLGYVSTFGNFETITSTDLNLACLSWAILAYASAFEEKPKLSRFPVSGFSAQTVNASEMSLSMAHVAFCKPLVPNQVPFVKLPQSLAAL
jgi:hypothetical protein